MKIGVRGKLFSISIALMLFVGLVSGLYLEHQLRLWFSNRLQKDLLQHARTAKLLLKDADKVRTKKQIDALSDQVGKSTNARLTIIRHDGVVLGDSHLSLKQINAIENHKNRPEIRTAQRRGEGISKRYSSTLKKYMLYVAVPYQRANDRGVVRVAMPMREVEEVISRLRILVLFAGILGMVVAIFMSWLASYLFSRMLRNVLQHTHAIAMTASQELPALPVNDDFEGLAGSLNTMANRLEQTVASMAAERNLFEAVLENMNAAVLAFDESQEVQLVNRSALSMMELTEPPIGQSLPELIKSDELLDLMAEVQKGEAASLELKLKGPPRRVLLVRATPLNTPGSSVMVLHDITEVRRLERIRRDFVANVSHELRTPVSIIRANAETLLDGALEEPELALDFLQALLRHAERLSALVSDLLEISRIEAGEHGLETHKTRLNPMIHRAHEAVEAILHNKQQTSSIEIGEDVDVLVDTRAFEQILLNLLDNAIKYTPEEGHIIVRSVISEKDVKIEVQDTGPGIKPKYRARIFERFYRVDKGRSRDMGGTGLGLAIVKHLTETMGGKVGVEPAETEGSIFWFSVPRARTESTKQLPS